MPRVTAPPAPQTLEQPDLERGAVAIFVTLLIVALFGFAAYVIDVGAIYQEQSGLQDGADSASLALAFDCLTNDTVTTCSDTATTRGQAAFYAEANSDDNQAEILAIDFDTSDQTVRVEVGTRALRNGVVVDEIDFAVAPALGTNDQGDDRSSARYAAEATVSWGTPIDLPVLPIIISSCEWDAFTNGGTEFGDDVALPITIPVRHSLNELTLCSGGPGVDIDSDGARIEGGFGYLESVPGCKADISGEYVQGQRLIPDPLLPINLGDILDGTEVLDELLCTTADLLLDDGVYIPIYDDVVQGPSPDPTCNDATEPCYHIYGYAKFVMDDSLPLNLDTVVDPILGLLGIVELPNLTGRFVEFTSVDYFGAIDPDLPNLGLSAIKLSE